MALKIGEHRHPSIRHFEHLFDYEHLPTHLRHISQEVHGSAQWMIERLEDGPELAAGLRKLLEAKDCFVRQALLDHQRSEAERIRASRPCGAYGGFNQAKDDCALPYGHDGKHKNARGEEF